MKQNKFLAGVVWLTLVVAIVGVFAAYLIETSRATDPKIGSHGERAGQLPVIKPLNDFTLTNQVGNAVSLTELKGRPWIANIFFTRCPSICVQMTQRMKEIQDALSPEQSLRLVSITTDPDHDQPEILSRYAKRFGADSDRWEFLTGTRNEIGRAIQKELLLAVQENPEDSRTSELDLYTHSSLLVLVDGESRIRATYESMGTNTVQEVIADLDRL